MASHGFLPLHKNIILVNLFAFVSQFIASELVMDEPSEAIQKIKVQLATCIRLLNQLEIKGVDVGVYFYDTCSLGQMQEIASRIDEGLILNRSISFNRCSMEATLMIGDIMTRIALPTYNKIDRLAVILAHEMTSTMHVERVIVFGDAAEAVDLIQLLGVSYNLYDQTKIPLQSFTYLGLFFDKHAFQEGSEIPLTLAIRKLQQSIIPILQKTNTPFSRLQRTVSKFINR